MRLFIFTGARVGEILSLRWEWINWDTQRAELTDSKTGKKHVHLPAPALDVLRALERPASGKGVVIRGGTGADPEVPLVNIKDPWRHLRAAAGLDDVRLHDLRHSFASAAVSGGISLPLIGALLGHRDVKTTARYAHLTTLCGMQPHLSATRSPTPWAQANRTRSQQPRRAKSQGTSRL